MEKKEKTRSEYQAEYYRKNKETLDKRMKQWRKDNPDKQKEYDFNRKTNDPDHLKRWARENKEHIKQYRKNYDRRRREIPTVKILKNLRSRAGNFFSGETKFHHMKEMLGCTLEEFKNHLESKWTEGMNWSNYGKGKGRWNIDHIVPCASFDFTNSENQRACFHFSNTQPMWGGDNSRKGKSI
jgi:hypothetical protein